MKEYLKNLAHGCEVDRIFIGQSEEMDDEGILHYRVKRMYFCFIIELNVINILTLLVRFLDWNDPHTESWLTFDILFKKKTGRRGGQMQDEDQSTDVLWPFTQKMNPYYQITYLGLDPTSQEKSNSRKDIVTGNTMTDCTMNLVKKFMKTTNYRRVFLDYVNVLLKTELREYTKQEKVLKLLSKVHGKKQQGSPGPDKVTQFEEFLKEKTSEHQKIPVLLDIYKKEGNLQLLENHRNPIVLLSFSNKQINQA